MPTARHAPGATDSKASHPTCTGAVIATMTPAAASRFDGATFNRRYICVCSCHYAARNTARTAMCVGVPVLDLPRAERAGMSEQRGRVQ
jgi:hypothetical protein